MKIEQFLFADQWDAAAQVLPQARNPDRRRHPDLRGPRQRGRLGAPGAFPSRRARLPDDRSRRAARLLQRDRPVLGQSACTAGMCTVPADYAWWVKRMRHIFEQVDIVRIDHFRGFEAYWEIPGNETTAIKGRWVPGPGADLFNVLIRELGRLPIIAEDLGRHHARRGAAARPVPVPGHADSPVRLRQRRQGRRLPARELSAELRGLFRHARQRHDRRLVPQRAGPEQHPHARGYREGAPGRSWIISRPTAARFNGT